MSDDEKPKVVWLLLVCFDGSWELEAHRTRRVAVFAARAARDDGNETKGPWKAVVQ